MTRTRVGDVHWPSSGWGSPQQSTAGRETAVADTDPLSQMVLSDVDLESELETGNLEVEPIEKEQQIQPASIDVRLGTEFQWLPQKRVISLRSELDGPTETRELGEGIAIEPDDFVLGTTLERVEIPDYLLGRLEGRSSVGRMGISVHTTAGIIDPGYEGEITLEISNDTDRIVVLEPGMRIGQLTLEDLVSPAERPYGAERGSKYQNQEGPTSSRINEDPEIEGPAKSNSELQNELDLE